MNKQYDRCVDAVQLLENILSWLVNCPTVSDMFLSSDGKLFDADGSAAEILREPKPSPWRCQTAKISRPQFQQLY